MRLRVIFGALAAAFTAYSGYWYYIAYYAEAYVQERADDMAAAGIDFSYDAIEVSGFPYRLILDFTNADFSLQQGDLQIDWRAPQLQAIAQPWNFRHLILFSERPQIDIRTEPGRARGLTLKPRFLQASYKTNTAGTKSISFGLEKVEINSADQQSLATSESAALHVRLYDTRGGNPETKGLVGTQLANVAIGLKGLKGLKVSGANSGTDLDISITPRGPFLPRLTSYSLAAWRDAGSTIEIEDVKIHAADWIAWGDGSISLDEQLRPLGALSLHADNTDNLLAWLAGIGLIDNSGLSEIQAAARTLHAMLGKGSDPLVPVTLQGGFLSIGPISVLPLRPLVDN